MICIANLRGGLAFEARERGSEAMIGRLFRKRGFDGAIDS